MDAAGGVEGADEEHACGEGGGAPEGRGAAAPFVAEEGGRDGGCEDDDAGDAGGEEG